MVIPSVSSKHCSLAFLLDPFLTEPTYPMVVVPDVLAEKVHTLISLLQLFAFH